MVLKEAIRILIEEGNQSPLKKILYKRINRIIYLNGLEKVIDTKDIFQDTVLVILEKHEEVRNWPCYLYRVIYHKIINELRRIIKDRNTKQRKAIQNNKISSSVLEDILLKMEKDKKLNEALSLLDNKLREVLILYYIYDFKIKKIAQILVLPEGTVKSRLFKARKELGKILEKQSYF